jgi:hypothetical protein
MVVSELQKSKNVTNTPPKVIASSQIQLPTAIQNFFDEQNQIYLRVLVH